MKNVLRVLSAVAFVSIVGIGRVEAQFGTTPAGTSVVKPVVTPVATPTPKPVPPRQGRCLFPSTRALSGIIADEAKKMYLKQGYKQAFVGVRVVIRRPVQTALTGQNVTGIKGIAAQTGSPANLLITANPDGAPIELGCNTEANLVTSVGLIDSAGKYLFGRTTTKVIVQGAFN